MFTHLPPLPHLCVLRAHSLKSWNILTIYVAHLRSSHLYSDVQARLKPVPVYIVDHNGRFCTCSHTSGLLHNCEFRFRPRQCRHRYVIGNYNPIHRDNPARVALIKGLGQILDTFLVEVHKYKTLPFVITDTVSSQSFLFEYFLLRGSNETVLKPERNVREHSRLPMSLQ